MKTGKLASARGQMHKARAAKNRAVAREDALRREIKEAWARCSALEAKLVDAPKGYIDMLASRDGARFRAELAEREVDELKSELAATREALSEARSGWESAAEACRELDGDLRAAKALSESAPAIRRALADLINEAQPLGIDRPTYQTALALLTRLEHES